MLWTSDGIDDVSDEYYNVEDDMEFFPTSPHIGTDWTAVEGIAILGSCCYINV